MKKPVDMRIKKYKAKIIGNVKIGKGTFRSIPKTKVKVGKGTYRKLKAPSFGKRKSY